MTYTYNPVLLEPPLLLENYGLAFPNNFYAKLALLNPNIIQELESPAKVRLCELIKDVSDFEPHFEENKHQLVFHYRLRLDRLNQ